MSEEEIVRAKMMFLGMIYFHSNGGYSREEIREKFEREFKQLKLKPFNGMQLGAAEMEAPSITLFAEQGHDLNSFEFDSRIKMYRGTALHEMTHKFFTNRNEKGEVVGTGLLKMLNKDLEFRNWLEESRVYQKLRSANFITNPILNIEFYENEFGRGGNEGYTEWFRKTVLKNDEDPTYQTLTSAFDMIQDKLEEKGENAIEIMKKFGEGDYNFLFETLNMSKEVGILFITLLDYIYQKEYDKEMIKKYMEAREKVKELRGLKIQNQISPAGEILLVNLEKFCSDIEFRLMKLERFKKCKSSEDIQGKLIRYIQDNDEKADRVLKKIRTIIQRTTIEQGKNQKTLELTDIEYIQKELVGYISEDKERGTLKTVKSDISIDETEEVPEQNYKKKKIKNKPATISKGRKLIAGFSGIGIAKYINKKMKKISEKMKSFVNKISKELSEKNSKEQRRINSEKMEDTVESVESFISGTGEIVQDNVESAIDSIKGIAENIKDKISDPVEDRIDNIGYSKDDLRYSISEEQVKIAAIIVALISIGIPTGIFAKYCIDNFFKDNKPVIEETIEETIDENEQQDDEKTTIIDEKEPIEEPELEENIGILEKYFKDGMYLSKGESVYRSSYKNDSDQAVMAYDYDNLYCDYIRVIRDGEVLKEGILNDIDNLYQIGLDEQADVMMRTGVVNEDGTITYIAWCDLGEMIQAKENGDKDIGNDDGR